VSLAYLLSSEFLALAQDRSGKEDPTFYDLKDAFFFGGRALGAACLCPRDGKPGCALVDTISHKHRGRCTHFLSWTWGYKLSIIRDALGHWHDVSGEDCAEEVFLFMCFFVNNQYRILHGEKTGAEDLEEVFEKNLARIGKVLALLDTWDNPRYLTRIWTIFEQVISIKLNVPVTMVLPREASQGLLDEIEQGKEGIMRVKNSLTRVDSASAEAFAPEDEAAVKNLINRLFGFHHVDEKIIQFMIKWIGLVMETHMKNLVSNVKVLRISRTVTTSDMSPVGSTAAVNFNSGCPLSPCSSSAVVNQTITGVDLDVDLGSAFGTPLPPAAGLCRSPARSLARSSPSPRSSYSVFVSSL